MTPFARLSIYGHDVDVVPGRADPALVEREACDACGDTGCRPAARVSWPVRYDHGVDAESETFVGRACIAAACEQARETLVADGTIAVDIARWNVTEACCEARVSRRKFDTWQKAGLFPAERVTDNRERADVKVLADAVWTLRRIGALVEIGFSPSKARDLLVDYPHAAEGLIADVSPDAIPA